MPYTIFISYTNQDKRIAEEVKKVINNAYQGHIQFYLAAHDLAPGREWKDEIKERLNGCNAIISIITPRSISKPWIYIEWTAFWMSDKLSYILLTDDIQISSLTRPMSDFQIVNMSLEDDIKLLFKELARVSKYEGPTPFNYVENFVLGIQKSTDAVLREIDDQTYGRYKNDISNLPPNNEEKGEIAEYFIDLRDYETFEKILDEITAESVKVKIARKLIESGDIKHTTSVIHTMRVSNYLKAVGKSLFDFGYVDEPVMREVIDGITNHTELRALGAYIFSGGQEDSNVFMYIVEKFTNMVELYKLGLYFVENDLLTSSTFKRLIQRLGTRPTQLEKLTEAFINHKIEESPQFENAIRLLQTVSIEETERSLSYLISHNRKLAQNYLDNGIISDPKLREYLVEQLS